MKLHDAIEKVYLANKKADKRNYRYKNENWWEGTVDVVDAGNNTATILLPNQTTATAPKPNKTNQTLVNGDKVWLFSPYGELGSAWIDVAFKKYV